jgi:polyhydroxybutyrate depolymerase
MPIPLVLVLHGYSNDPGYIIDYFRIESLAESRGFWCAIPWARGMALGVVLECDGSLLNFYGSTVDDSSYLRGLIEEVTHHAESTESGSILPATRMGIHVLSNGPRSCGHYRRHRESRGFDFLDFNSLRPSQPVNILQIHGTSDDVIPYAGESDTAVFPTL